MAKSRQWVIEGLEGIGRNTRRRVELQRAYLSFLDFYDSPSYAAPASHPARPPPPFPPGHQQDGPFSLPSCSVICFLVHAQMVPVYPQQPSINAIWMNERRTSEHKKQRDQIETAAGPMPRTSLYQNARSLIWNDQLSELWYQGLRYSLHFVPNGCKDFTLIHPIFPLAPGRVIFTQMHSITLILLNYLENL